MISLNEYIEEGLLGGFNEIEASMDPIKEIKQFINANFNIDGRLIISKEPNKNGKYEVSCDSVWTKNKDITSLTNGMFEWGEIEEDFSCSRCMKLTSLKGAPKKVGVYFSCGVCKSLKSLKGAPKEVGGCFNCFSCHKLTSLGGTLKKVDIDFDCSLCSSLTSIEGAPKEVNGYFDCRNCGKKFDVDEIAKICKVKGKIMA